MAGSNDATEILSLLSAMARNRGEFFTLLPRLEVRIGKEIDVGELTALIDAELSEAQSADVGALLTVLTAVTTTQGMTLH